jgi:DNA-binding response OmpR family regulator
MSGSGRLVLVVEDDDHIRGFLSEALTDEGYRVAQAANGRLGLALLIDARPDLVILDLMMPDMDGWSFRAAQQRRPDVAEIPVIILSASRHLAEHARALQAAAVFAKPFDLNELLEAVGSVLRGEEPAPREDRLLGRSANGPGQ